MAWLTLHVNTTVFADRDSLAVYSCCFVYHVFICPTSLSELHKPSEWDILLWQVPASQPSSHSQMISFAWLRSCSQSSPAHSRWVLSLKCHLNTAAVCFLRSLALARETQFPHDIPGKLPGCLSAVHRTGNSYLLGHNKLLESENMWITILLWQASLTRSCCDKPVWHNPVVTSQSDTVLL